MTDEQKRELTEYIRSIASAIRTQHGTEAKRLHAAEVAALDWLWNEKIPVDSNALLSWMRSMIRQVVLEEQKGN